MIRLGVVASRGYIVGIAQKITMNKRTKSNTIRIISGQWRGRRLPVLTSEGLRPTTDRVRETLFNWLMYDVPDAHCLDLFAGTGVLGLECLSRGAANVVFVEKSTPVAQTLRENLLVLDPQATAQVVAGNAIDYLRSEPPQTFDIVFLDPPFQSELLAEAIRHLQDRAWLHRGALVYVEQSSGEPQIEVPAQWQLHRNGRAGQSNYALYQVAESLANK